MSGAQHTPWMAEGYIDRDNVRDANGDIIAAQLKPAVARLTAAGPDLLDACVAGERMRDAQVRYFKDRSRENLIASKEAERDFDTKRRAAIAKATGA